MSGSLLLGLGVAFRLITILEEGRMPAVDGDGWIRMECNDLSFGHGSGPQKIHLGQNLSQ